MTLAGRKAVSSVMDTPKDMWRLAVFLPAPHYILVKSDWGPWDRPPTARALCSWRPAYQACPATGSGEAKTGKFGHVSSCKLVGTCAVKSAGALNLEKIVIIFGGGFLPIGFLTPLK